MSRLLRAIVLLTLVAACGAPGNFSAPRNLNDACSILNQRPAYLKAMRNSERRWGIPIYVQMAVMYQESKFIGNARTPVRYKLGVIPMGRQSSAFGYSQALDGTWQEYKDGPGRNRARRDNIKDATDFMGWYMAKTTERLGIAKNDARNQYLAYHDGRTGFLRGTYRSKPWLIRIAGEIEDRAALYKYQLVACRKI